ncbi:hypothetical protein F4827_007104 [Paraburkholderia bannensis]|uniref:Uncharacterized protein n=1 Tax=Paraburkholderia bannensis TaxID=765414 RepID=A0A7W9U568_9BURK|nr:hypothetical protein [Paraburkholderia sp. WP4_3_2]MBB6107222.1 hypothetical protein [Paraburkholderia bannensis]
MAHTMILLPDDATHLATFHSIGSRRFTARGRKYHPAAINTASPVPNVFASLRQLTATVLRVCFSFFYRHFAPGRLMRPLQASGSSRHCIIVRFSRIV